MKILFDQGTPVPLRHYLSGHEIHTVFELGWASLSNGELLAQAEGSFELLVTTDQQLRNQQNLTTRKLSILVLMTTAWPRIKSDVDKVVTAINQIQSGEYQEVIFD